MPALYTGRHCQPRGGSILLFNTVTGEPNMDVGAAKTLDPAAVGKGSTLDRSTGSN